MASIEIELNAKEIAITSQRQDLIEFVKELDEAMGEWDFTLALCDYFERSEWRAPRIRDLAVFEMQDEQEGR